MENKTQRINEWGIGMATMIGIHSKFISFLSLFVRIYGRDQLHHHVSQHCLI